jgi:polysaccharide biosynthesis protein PslG
VLAASLCLLLAPPLAGALSGCGSGADATAPRSTFVGLTSQDAFDGPPAYQDATLAREKKLGVEILRQTFDWATLEPAPGRFRLAKTDRFVLAAAKQGIAVLPILFHAPPWATGKTRSPQSNVVDPPRRPASLAAFARAMVRRYGPRGSLWRAHAGVDPVPVRDWQVWNEPNLPQYWGNRPDAAAYAKLLDAAHRAIHAADRGARVLSAGLPESALGVRFATYVRALYREGARTGFDVFAVHPYSSSTRGVLAAVRKTRALMRRYGDNRKPVWVTELGWASAGPKSPFTFDPLSQAQLVATTIDALSAERRALRIAGFVYFDWKDGRPYPGRSDFWGLHTGLLSADGGAKPSLAAFRDAVQRARG